MNELQLHAENVRQSAAKISGALGSLKPKIAVILGSGLGGLARQVENPVTLAYRDLPGFPMLTVAGHAGQLIIGKLSGVPVIVLNGRKHFYETSDAYPLKTMIRSMKAAGVQTIFLSNAAGSLRAHIKVSELMLITDHINFLGLNPLVGPNDESFGPRFFPMADAWDPELGAKLKAVAKEQGVTLHQGVYVAFRGPSFETHCCAMLLRMRSDCGHQGCPSWRGAAPKLPERRRAVSNHEAVSVRASDSQMTERQPLP